MAKPSKRTAATAAKQNDDAPAAKSTRVTRSNQSSNASATTSTASQKTSTAKKPAIVPKKRKIVIEEPAVSETEETTAPSSSQEESQNSQSSETTSSPKRGKRGVKKAIDVNKDRLPFPTRPADTIGSVLAVGTGDIGQLGLGEDVLEKGKPGLVTIPEAVCSAIAGGMHSVCLTETGSVYTFGCNDDGALGRLTPDEEQQFEPGLVKIDEKVVQISAGDSHCGALTESGKVYIWGNFRDFKGQMGLTTGESEKGEPLPVQILKDISIVEISSGGNHFLALDKDGNMYSLGSCEHGQLGRVSAYNLERGGRKKIESILIPEVVSLNKNVKCDKIWGGTYSSFARAKKTGEIYGFGLGNFGQLGVELKGRNTIVAKPKLLKSFSGKNWEKISSGDHHTLALDSEGKVYSLGKHEYGRLGLGNSAQDVSTPTLIPLLQDVECLDISCGSVTSYAVAKDGSVYSWGSGSNNMLGHDTDDDILEPRKIVMGALRTRKGLTVSGGGQHALFISKDKEESNGN